MANSAGQEQQLIAGWRAIERNDPGTAEAAARDVLRQIPSHPQLGLLAYNLLAVSLMQQSRHEEALGALAWVLEREPRSAGTLLNLGSALTHLGRYEEAIPRFRKAAELDPQLSQAHNNLGHALNELSRFDEAAKSLRRALRIAPDDAEVHNNLGTALAGLGRRDEAVIAYRRALALRPGYVSALNNLGVVLDQLDRHEEALECFRKAVALDPANADVHTNMGVVYQRMKRFDEAVAAHQKAISIAPRVAGAHLNLGLALREQGLLEAAAESFQGAASLKPDYADAHMRLGTIYRALGRHDEAIACLRRALSIKPDHVEALLHLGSACQEQGRLAEMLAHFETAIALDPGSADAHHNRGIALQALSRHEEAIASFREALRLDPEHKYTLGALLWSELLGCRWEAREAEIAALKAAVRAGKSLTEPFALMAVSEDLEELRLCAEKFYEDRVRSRRTRLWNGERYEHSRIRIAYLSADFREHAVAGCIAELIERHDRSKFEIIGASLGVDDGSATRSRLLRGFDRFLDLRPAGDLDAAMRLRETEVDIVVDLMGYTNTSRPGLLAHRPSPIQVAYLGYPGTVGADFLDYILADPFVLPEEHQRFYSERVVYLPDSYQANDSKREIAERVPTRAEAGLPESGFVYCCFNNSYKIAPKVFDIWMRLLAQVPGSVLWILGDNAAAGENLRKEAGARGIAPERLVFARRVSVAEYRARCRLADLFLDTLPYNGHGTTSDMLWSGLPVLTCAGTTFAGRVAGSLLHAAGLPELVTSSLERYEALALRLARERALLAELRERLQRNRTSAALFDTKRFCRHLESAFRTMWETSQRGEQPRSFAVEPIE
jgi:protein O-GlcNAc transferase